MNSHICNSFTEIFKWHVRRDKKVLRRLKGTDHIYTLWCFRKYLEKELFYLRLYESGKRQGKKYNSIPKRRRNLQHGK